jgi:uncharacterized protein YdeI (YjbR/CyaY-like superfamily)
LGNADVEFLADLPILPFAAAADWESWLEDNHTANAGVWLKFAKKGSGISSLTYAEAVEVALCFGWIDGQAKSYDDAWWLQRFTPRRSRSIWSRVNREKAEALMRSGRVRPSGLAAIEAARSDGRWDAAYEPSSTAAVPDDLRAALDRSPSAAAKFETLRGANRYAILFRIQTAKRPETRQRRIEKFVAMLERGETIY